jgi:threonine synthase
MEKNIAKEDLKNGPERRLQRYAKFLPVESEHIVSLGEGVTPLIFAENLSVQTGSKNILLKRDFCNPSGSFKDRGASVLISNAKKLHVKEVAIDSSGNNASSISAYSALAGIKCYVFSPSYASRGKLVQSMAYGSRLFGVEGTRHETYLTAYSAVETLG